MSNLVSDIKGFEDIVSKPINKEYLPDSTGNINNKLMSYAADENSAVTKGEKNIAPSDSSMRTIFSIFRNYEDGEDFTGILENASDEEFSYISSIYELKGIVSQMIKYLDDYKIILNDTSLDIDDKLNNLNKLKKKIVELSTKLQKGMYINIDSIKKQIIDNIIKFLKIYNIKTDLLEEELSNITFFVTDTKLCLEESSKAAYYGGKIALDYQWINFDKNGNIIGLKEENIKLLSFIITHELLHATSHICSNNKTSVSGDGCSEGLTEMFAHIISGNYEDKSEKYDILVRVFELFAKLIGVEKVLDDYINNLDNYPNIQELFNACGLSEEYFLKFKSLMSDLIKNYDNAALKIEVINNIKEYIFIPSVKKIENKEEYIELFNKLFSEFGVSCSLSEVSGFKK